jgi:hypothetical protein
MTQQRPFRAEILFREPGPKTVSNAKAALEMFGFSYQTIPTEDVDEDTSFGLIEGVTEVSEDTFGDWFSEIVEPLGGDIIEWGFMRLR